ncbi:MAG: hypothetical protein ACKO4R_04710 [Synechococcales cyanobacterium]
MGRLLIWLYYAVLFVSNLDKQFYPVEMIVREANLKHGTAEQYSAIDEAIRTAQFIRNKAVG